MTSEGAKRFCGILRVTTFDRLGGKFLWRLGKEALERACTKTCSLHRRMCGSPLQILLVGVAQRYDQSSVQCGFRSSVIKMWLLGHRKRSAQSANLMAPLKVACWSPFSPR